MRKSLFALLCTLPLTGCATCGSGWYGEAKIGKAGVVSHPMLYSQMAGPVALSGGAAFPAGPVSSGIVTMAEPPEVIPPPRRALVAPPPTCTLDEICRKLDQLIQLQQRKALPEQE